MGAAYFYLARLGMTFFDDFYQRPSGESMTLEALHWDSLLKEFQSLLGMVYCDSLDSYILISLGIFVSIYFTKA